MSYLFAFCCIPCVRNSFSCRRFGNVFILLWFRHLSTRPTQNVPKMFLLTFLTTLEISPNFHSQLLGVSKWWKKEKHISKLSLSRTFWCKRHIKRHPRDSHQRISFQWHKNDNNLPSISADWYLVRAASSLALINHDSCWLQGPAELIRRGKIQWCVKQITVKQSNSKLSHIPSWQSRK